MKKTTRLKKPQIPELDHLYDFDDLGGRPKYGGVEMTSETNIPSFDEIRDETHSMVVAEATARDDADEELQAQITAQGGDIAAETSARQAADTALQTALEAETTARTTADTNLAQSITDEATARAAADAAEVTARNNAIAAETTARQTADTGLQTQIDAIVASSDVKDIVGTYADLQAYDTSTLGDRDIIKVLQDETHQDETTYYRWGATAQTFTLIGEEGPYYTKAATDTLLNDKADKATTYTKTETDTLLGAKADQATTYTKTEVDTALSAKQDTLTAGDAIDITNNVIKATNTGKAKELTSADYNANSSNWSDTDPANFNCIAAWELPNGMYTAADSVAIYYMKNYSLFNNEKKLFFIQMESSSAGWLTAFARANGGIDTQYITIKRTTGASGYSIEESRVLLHNNVVDDLTHNKADLPLSAKQGKVLNEKIEGRIIQNAGAPTTSTVGTVGKLYEDTTNGKLYQCTAVSGSTYTWEEVGAGNGIKTLDYYDYNPDYRTTRNPALCFGQYLVNIGAKVGEIYTLENYYSGSGVTFNLGEILDSGGEIKYWHPDDNNKTKIYVLQNDAEGNQRKIVLAFVNYDPLWFMNETSSMIVEMSYCNDKWCYNTASDILLRHDVVPYNAYGVSFNNSKPRALSSNAGQELTESFGAAMNIAGVTAATIEDPQFGNTPTFIFEKVMNPWDFEWRGTFRAIDEFNSGLDLTTAPDGTMVLVWARDENGIPLVLNVPEDGNPYSFEVETDYGMIQVKPSKSDYEPLFAPSNIVTMTKTNGQWNIAHGGQSATILPRQIEFPFINGGTTAPTTATVGTVGTVYSYVDTTGATPVPHLMVCTVADTVTPEYTWVEAGGGGSVETYNDSELEELWEGES